MSTKISKFNRVHLRKAGTHNLPRIVFVAISFHIPDNLVAEKLRNLCSFEDESLDVTWYKTRMDDQVFPVREELNLPRLSLRKDCTI